MVHRINSFWCSIKCQEKTVPKNPEIFGTVCRLLIRASMIFYFQEVRMMFMNGEYVKTIEDLKRCLSLEELVYNYYSGELEIWLRKIGETEKADQLQHIQKDNAYLLVQLYAVFGWNPELSDEEIRRSEDFSDRIQREKIASTES